METADVVVVGGGIIGAAIAYNLGARGVKTILLEKELLFGAESTAKCAGGIRAQFSTPINIQLSMASIKLFEQFEETMGIVAPFLQVGYLFMSLTEAQWKASLQNVVLQRAMGVPVQTLGADEVKALVPVLRTDDVVGATFCQTDGLADPHTYLQAYLTRCRQLGVGVHNLRAVTGVRVEHGRIVEVQTDKGPIATRTVVNAAGAWADDLARMVDLTIPIVPVRRHIATTTPLSFIAPTYPMMIDNGTGLYMHPESGGLLLGMANKAEPPAYNTVVDDGFIMKIVEAGISRMPALEDAGINAAWAGLYEVTPDHHPIIGRHPRLSDLVIAAGFSGHGFMHAPITGQLVAELVVDGRPSIDITSLGIERFLDEGREPQEEVCVI